MESIQALEILKKWDDIEFGESLEQHSKKINKAIKELESFLIMKDNKTTFKDYVFTTCNDCINKVDYKFTSACFGCKRYYSCRFKLRDK